MKSWTISWESRAVKELKKLDRQYRIKIVEAVENLSKDPAGGIPLTGQWEGLWRLRVGSFRVIYGLDHGQLLILIVHVGHRKDVYE